MLMELYNGGKDAVQNRNVIIYIRPFVAIYTFMYFNFFMNVPTA